jgi:hypothetical protein
MRIASLVVACLTGFCSLAGAPATEKPAAGPKWMPVLTLSLSIVGASSLDSHPTQSRQARPSEARMVAIDNTEPRRDLAGQIIDAHDGCLQFFEGRYYLYGTAYGNSAGFSINNRFRVYSSADLVRWIFEGELLKAPPDGVYYRPYVIFNPNTRKYVLWYNWYPKLWEGQVGIATSDSPVGPFTLVQSDVQVSQAKFRPGDGSLFADEDGTGYFIYTVIGQDHAIRVEQLKPDYLGSAGKVSEILGTDCESPVLFRRGNVYYALFDKCCCFCPVGSGARVFTASSALGPFTERMNINRQAGNGSPIVAAQQTWVARIPTSDGPAFVWMGDRWGSRLDGLKGHDLQFWSPPLKFAPDGSILPLEPAPGWKARVLVGGGSFAPLAPYFWPKKRDPNPSKSDGCTGKPLSPEQFDGLPTTEH